MSGDVNRMAHGTSAISAGGCSNPDLPQSLSFAPNYFLFPVLALPILPGPGTEGDNGSRVFLRAAAHFFVPVGVVGCPPTQSPPESESRGRKSQREKQMKRTLLVGLLVFLCLEVADGARLPAKQIKGVTQTWTYDATTHSGTLRIENIAHKPIVAYNFSTYVPEKDGSEFVSGSAGKAMDSPPGNPPFMPGEVKTETVTVGPDDPDTTRVAVDMVIYDDHTAEVTNSQVLEQWLSGYKKQADAMQKVADVMEAELRTANSNHKQAIQAELERRLAPLKAKKDPRLPSNGFESADEAH